MLIGVPASGKSTWVNKSIGSIMCNDTFVYSTDAYIEKIAENLGMTYDDVFKDIIDRMERFEEQQQQKDQTRHQEEVLPNP